MWVHTLMVASIAEETCDCRSKSVHTDMEVAAYITTPPSGVSAGSTVACQRYATLEAPIHHRAALCRPLICSCRTCCMHMVAGRPSAQLTAS